MESDTTTEGDVIDTLNDNGEGDVETVSISKKDYDTLNQTLGSLKREIKDLKKPKEEPKETKDTPQTKSEESALLQKLERLSLRQAGIEHPDDIELARNTAKKWGVDIDEVIADEDFKVKLEKNRTTRDNALASSNIRGGTGTTQAKNTSEYWIAKGVPPTKMDVPDRKVRAQIAKAFMAKSEGIRFYNE